MPTSAGTLPASSHVLTMPDASTVATLVMPSVEKRRVAVHDERRFASFASRGAEQQGKRHQRADPRGRGEEVKHVSAFLDEAFEPGPGRCMASQGQRRNECRGRRECDAAPQRRRFAREIRGIQRCRERKREARPGEPRQPPTNQVGQEEAARPGRPALVAV